MNMSGSCPCQFQCRQLPKTLAPPTADTKILRDPKYPKPWKLWYHRYEGHA